MHTSAFKDGMIVAVNVKDHVLSYFLKAQTNGGTFADLYEKLGDEGMQNALTYFPKLQSIHGLNYGKVRIVYNSNDATFYAEHAGKRYKVDVTKLGKDLWHDLAFIDTNNPNLRFEIAKRGKDQGKWAAYVNNKRYVLQELTMENEVEAALRNNGYAPEDIAEIMEKIRKGEFRSERVKEGWLIGFRKGFDLFHGDDATSKRALKNYTIVFLSIATVAAAAGATAFMLSSQDGQVYNNEFNQQVDFGNGPENFNNNANQV